MYASVAELNGRLPVRGVLRYAAGASQVTTTSCAVVRKRRAPSNFSRIAMHRAQLTTDANDTERMVL